MIGEQKPEWLTILPPNDPPRVSSLRATLRSQNLHTVCEESHCPNIAECWSGGTATFMVLGKECTRACRFCNVATNRPKPLDAGEPKHLAETVKQLGLDYVVITSVDRDDLPDQGAAHFAECVKEAKKTGVRVEVLTPDFRGNRELVRMVCEAGPDVYAHNIETVERLQRAARDPRAGYEQSLSVLRAAKEFNMRFTKSSIMLGLGEEQEEVLQAMRDLRGAGVDFLTIGQYLRPSEWHLPIARFATPAEFDELAERGRALGFRYVAAGPFVRSSYKAGELFIKNVLKQEQVV
ncbi:lipoyl synthase [Candidatus Micrarchaeota archaeon]|nr:lipoyl synthase [Candidatus Micrarchaeota archaeon]